MIGLIGWLWIFGLGVTKLGTSAVTTSAPLLGVVGAALGAYMLVAVSLGFLLGQVGLGQNVASTVANIGGLAMSFLSGVWVPTELLPDAVIQVSKFTPGYWAAQAISGAYTATSMSADIIRPLLVDCGICTLFAVAIFAVAMAVGRTRAQSSL